jgi:hypothetical protein
VEIAEMTDVSPAARLLALGRHWRVIASVTAALLAIGAFLAYGPIGLGPGPIGNETVAGGVAGPVPRTQPAVFVTDIDAGASGAVIDSIQVRSDGRYPAPKVIGMTGDGYLGCAGARPLSGRQSFASDCDAGGRIRLFGRPLPRVDLEGYPGVGAAIETAPPGPAGCWQVTAVVIHYHVGIRHYTASDEVGVIGCSSPSLLKAAG